MNADAKAMMLSNHVEIIDIDSWQSFQSHVASYSQGHNRYKWCFRGHAEWDWLLETSLERLSRHPHENMERAERILLGRFKRQAHHFLTRTPAENDFVEWLALMQHWGVPTRLLDFTLSPYVALFFALREKPRAASGKMPDGHNCECSPTHAALWAMHHVGLQSLAMDEFRAEGTPIKTGETREALKNALRKGSLLKAVLPIQPFFLNERLAAQQGLFLCPVSFRLPFELLITQSRYFGIFPRDGATAIARKLRIPLSQRGKMLRELFRMNIGSASLFPGLEGYARSIGESYSALEG